MKFPDDLRYTPSHEWVRREADGTLTIGITDHAQDSLGELVFVETPEKGRRLAAGDGSGAVRGSSHRRLSPRCSAAPLRNPARTLW